MDKRRMCPNCRAFITTDDRVCPYCDMEIGMRAVDRRMAADTMAGVLQGDRFLTTLILVVNIGLYLATLSYSGGSLDPSFQALQVFGAKDGYAIFRGMQWWRLVTAGFLHGGVLHILMNSWVLWGLGPQVDQIFGGYRFLAIYLLSSVAGFAASLFWSPAVLSIGASAGISGLIGAMVGLGTREKHTIIGRERNHYIQWMVLVLVQGFIIPGIDNAAHIGGFVGGFCVAYLSGARGSARGDDGVWKTVAIVCGAITAYAFFRMVEQLLLLRA